MVSVLDYMYRLSGPGLSPGRGLCCVLGQDTLLSQYLSPPRFINGYWPNNKCIIINIGGNPAMGKNLI